MVTCIGILIRIKNNSAKEKVIFIPAEFPGPVSGAAVVQQGGCNSAGAVVKGEVGDAWAATAAEPYLCHLSPIS